MLYQDNRMNANSTCTRRICLRTAVQVVARRRELLALQQQPPLGGRRAMSAAGAAANAITAFGSSSSSYDGRSSYDGSSSSGYSGRRRLLQSTFGPALLLLDLALVRSVEVAVLTTPKVSTYAEIANVQVGACGGRALCVTRLRGRLASGCCRPGTPCLSPRYHATS